MKEFISAEEEKVRKQAEESDILADEIMSKYHLRKRRDILEKPETKTSNVKKRLDGRRFKRVAYSLKYVDAVRKDIESARLMHVTEKRKITGKMILKSIAIKHGLRVADLKSHCRSRHIMPARFEACYEMRRLTPLSMPQIGKILGGRDHTTVLHGVRQHAIRNGLPRLDSKAGEAK